MIPGTGNLGSRDDIHRLTRRVAILQYYLEMMMSVQDNLQQDEQALAQDEATLKTTVAAQVADIQAEINNLKGQIPDPAALSAVDQKLQQLHQSLTADTAAVAAADPGAQPAPAPQPPSPGPTPTPTPAPQPPSPTPPAPTPGPTQSVYVFDGDPTTVDPSVWPRSGFETVDTPPRPLFYFSGDTQPGDANGAGQPNWSVYAGSVQPATT